ncbi:LacI family DNA-binding transcriptional regulator [Bradyrhizobium betae]|uniref:LacI family DNA-binding transcriptional regulator n=1 Tax=Bradyrhizobium betae TaxID=244734 RepID=UPI003D667A04
MATSTTRTTRGKRAARPAPARPTQKDIALAAGVSQAAVSLVLNKTETPSVPPATRTRILQVAQELGYQPRSSGAHAAQCADHDAGLRHPRHHQSVLSGSRAWAADGRGAGRL